MASQLSNQIESLNQSEVSAESRSGSSLEISALRKRFGDLEVIRNLDLQILPGEFIAIVGRSGCGKSTLLRLVAGLETPTEGVILANGKPRQGLDPEARVMFQDARLLPWKSVIKNVALGLREEAKDRAREALHQVGLADRANDWPKILSGGQQQRVALARALASRPRLLALDEPLGALDALTRLEMQALIESLWQAQKFTALLVTHDPEEAVALADRVLVMENGQFVLDLPINLPRPRIREDAEFWSLKEQILNRVLNRQTD
jgi:sulfonate transport system ATP-binding protein